MTIDSCGARLRRAAPAVFSGIAPAAMAALACMSLRVDSAHACGGLFCSGGQQSTTTTQASFVNQTAERIVFVDNDDGTITAIIQIVYEGPADRFAWIVPVPGVPDVKVSSTVVLDALQQQTNPQYRVTTTQLACPVPSGGGNFGSCGPCGNCSAPAGLPAAGTGASAPSPSELNGSPVVVEAAGSIGPYDWRVLSVDPLAFDPAVVAIDWLTQNEFDIGELGPEVLRPYLQDGLNLLAFKLSKQASVGSIRPVMLTYAAEQPSIPILPTAVAADDDMGVLVWIAADHQAVPLTYSSVVLNEALVDWFDPASNYAAVVSAAADEAGGRSFATEFAGALTPTAVVRPEDWAAFSDRHYDDWRTLVSTAFTSWGTWDGFSEALGAAAILPEGTTLADLERCLPALADAAAPGLEDCAALLTPDGEHAVDFDGDVFEQKLGELVVLPVIDSFAVLASRPYLTRLYTTLSPDEMTVDPVFGVNSDLLDVSNVHLTQRTVQCASTVGSMQLPQGGTIVTDVNGSSWPVQMSQLPAALQIVQHGTSGAGLVLVDERASVIGKTFGLAACRGDFGASGGTGGNRADYGVGAVGGSAGSGGSGATLARGGSGASADSSGGGCSAARSSSDNGAGAFVPVALVLAGMLAGRRRRRCGSSAALAARARAE